jgi:hypothetical protein
LFHNAPESETAFSPREEGEIAGFKFRAVLGDWQRISDELPGVIYVTFGLAGGYQKSGKQLT